MSLSEMVHELLMLAIWSWGLLAIFTIPAALIAVGFHIWSKHVER